MCSLKLSKSIFPFALTFVLGIFVAGAFSYFFSPSKVATPKVNEVKVYSSVKKKSSCNAYKNNTYRSRSKRIERPTLRETIIINEEVKKSSK